MRERCTSLITGLKILELIGVSELWYSGTAELWRGTLVVYNQSESCVGIKSRTESI